LRQITVPILITAVGGHYFIADNEIHYNVAASKDKVLVVIEGTVHGQTLCETCSRVPGQPYSNATTVCAWSPADGRFNVAPAGACPESRQARFGAQAL
jgi:hypothetical protein